MATCTSISWSSAVAAIQSFFQQATAAPEKEEEKHKRILRRQLSLNSSQNFGSFDTDGGILGDKSIWDFYVDADQAAEKHHRYAKIDSAVPPPGDLCSGLDHCFVESDHEEDYTPPDDGENRRGRRTGLSTRPKYDRNRPRRSSKERADEGVPSRESSSISSFTSDEAFRKRNRKRPDYVILYRPRREVLTEDNMYFDVVWQRECVDLGTRLVRWQGSLEMSNPNPLLARSGTQTSTLTSSTWESQPSMNDSEVGWITAYNISRGLNEMACAASVDPVLLHFCKRFGLWANHVNNMKGQVPTKLDDESLFYPYGSHPAEVELQRRLTQGQAPDGSVLDIAAVLQGMPIFFISDLFIDPDWRGNGLGLVLLDRACRRVAESFCLVVVFLRDYTDERLPMYLGLLGFSFLAPGFVMRRHGHGQDSPRLEEVCPFLPPYLANTSGGKL